jgi:hypothetical protein
MTNISTQAQSLTSHKNRKNWRFPWVGRIFSRCPLGAPDSAGVQFHEVSAAVLILFAIATSLYSQEIPRLYRSAHFALRGDTGTADADNQEAIFYNPAGLALGKGIYKRLVLVSPQVEISSATKDLAREIGAEEADAIEAMRGAIGKHQTLATSNFSGVILRRVAIGAYANGSVQGLVSKSAEELPLNICDERLDKLNSASPILMTWTQ